MCLMAAAMALGMVALAIQKKQFEHRWGLERGNQIRSLVRGIEQGLLLDDDFILEAMVQAGTEGGMIRIEIFDTQGHPVYPPELDPKAINDAAKAACQSQVTHTQAESAGGIPTQAMYVPLRGPGGALGAVGIHHPAASESGGWKWPFVLILIGAAGPMIYGFLRETRAGPSPVSVAARDTAGANAEPWVHDAPSLPRLIRGQGAHMILSENRVLHVWGDFSRFLNEQPHPGEHLARAGGLGDPKKLAAVLGQAPWPESGISVHIFGGTRLRIVSFFLDDKPDKAS